jgi:hypothetical protein
MTSAPSTHQPAPSNNGQTPSRRSIGGTRWTSLIGLGLRTYLARRISLLSNTRHWQRNSAGIQLAQLRNLLTTASNTEFGRSHDFARIATLQGPELLNAYRQAVPIADWYAYRSLISRMREGAEPDLLWPGVVRDFAQTSGTTAGDKFIPVSKEMLKSNYLASLDIFGNLARFGVSITSLLSGKSLFLGGSTKLDTSDKGIRTGDLSGIVAPLIRWPLSEIYLPGKQIAVMSHWPTKLDAMAARCVDEDVRMISGVPSWGLVLMEKCIGLLRQRGVNANTIRDVWPNFQVFVHGGVKYGPFEARMRQIFSGSPEGDDIPVRHELYPASEGFIAMQDTPRNPGLRLNVDQMNFFEFVPLEEIANQDARAFTCETVEKGQKYVVVMSTCAGLWRYVLGDVVEFDTIPDKLAALGGGGGDGPARMRIVGRHRHFINAFGENLIVEHIENAIEAAGKVVAPLGIVIGEFTAAPIYPATGQRAGLEVAIELKANSPTGTIDPAQAPALIQSLRNTIDGSLKAQNVDYTTKRTDGLGMGEPTITPLPMGTFHKWMDSRGKLGGQHKCPRCANGREIIDQVREFAGIHTPNHDAGTKT